jgi:hypothetical protein
MAMAPTGCSGDPWATTQRQEIVMAASLRLVGTLAALVCASSLTVAAPAAADQAFHTERIPLSAVAGAPLASGTVIDVHTNGPAIYAQERYLLRGAEPATTYQVSLNVYNDPGCTALLFRVATATMTTNVAGNAEGKWTFHPADVAGLAPGTLYVVWQVSVEGGAVAYASDCIPVALD